MRARCVDVRGAAPTACAYPEPRDGVDWEELGFGLTTKDTQVAIARCSRGGEWGEYSVEPYRPLEIEPASTALNYGQSIFEGMKAYRTQEGRIVLFRPEMNARRLASGAERLMMPPVPEDLFLRMVTAAVRANADWVPPLGAGALYLRPLLFGSGPALGVGPSPEFTLVVYAAPVGEYFKDGVGAGALMRLERAHQRAATRGVGDVKFAGNYAPCFLPQSEAKAAGFSDIIYLDETEQFIEEAAASNFFCVSEGGVLRTPGLGTILPGVTRDSVLRLAKKLAGAPGSPITAVDDSGVPVDVAFQAKEAFLTGTAAGLMPVRGLVGDERSADFEVMGPVTKFLRDSLQAVQLEKSEDADGWLLDPFDDA